MIRNAKCRLSLIVLGASVVGAIRGLILVRSEGFAEQSPAPGMVLLLGSVVVGLAAAVSYRYLEARKDDAKTREQIAVETLAKADELQRDKTLPKSKQKRWHS
jgi:hypothetical protein